MDAHRAILSIIFEQLISSSSYEILFTIVCSRDVVKALRSQNYLIDWSELVCIYSSLEVYDSPQNVVIAFFIWFISLFCMDYFLIVAFSLMMADRY